MTATRAATEAATPLKCGTCNRPMDSPLFCANCQALYAVEDRDFYELLGMARRYDLDAAELRTRYLRLAREVHPDRFGARSDAADLSQRASALLNRAYQVLVDPVLRAEYLLELSGGRSSAQDKTVPHEVLTRTLMIREEIEEAKAAGDAEALRAHRRAIEAEFEATRSEIAALAGRLPGDEEVRRALREKLNTVKYFQRMLEQV